MQRRPATDDEARALASALRLRILRVCLGEAHTNQEIAERLGANPASTLHHVRMLVRTGFLAAQEERRGARNAREIPYLATGKSWTLSSPARDNAMLDAFGQEIAQVPRDMVLMSRLGLRRSAARLQAFLDRLQDLLDEVVAEPDDPDGQPWSMFVALHPDLSRGADLSRIELPD